MAIINCYDVNGDAIRFLTQWDHNISIRATGVKTSPIPEFRFSNKHSQKSKCICGVVVGDGVKATIPNGFLQEALPIYVQLFYTYPSGDAKTEHTFVIPVKPSSMPDGAVYEPVEVRSIVELEKRVKALEENGVPGAGGVPSDPSFDTVSLGGDAGVVIIPEGTADAPAITFYGARGDEPVALNNVADATDDRSAPNLGQVKQLVEEHSGQTAALTADERSSLIAVVNAIGAFNVPNGRELIDAFNTAWGGEVPEPDQPEKTLVSISATYSGGEVAVGTALSALTGVVVTAHYSDGSTVVVTGYTLSGEIAEGSNTITVSYGGKTATVTVVGVASGDEEPVEPLYGRFWPPKGKVLDWNNHTWDDVENFAYTSNIAGTPTEYTNAGLPGGSFVRLDRLQGTVYIRTLTKNQYGIMEQGAYSVYANSDGEISTGGFAKIPHTIYREFGGKAKTVEVDGTTYYFTLFKFEIPVGQTGYFISTHNAMREGYFISADLTSIDDAYKPYYTLFGSDPSDRITEPATEVV